MEGPQGFWPAPKCSRPQRERKAFTLDLSSETVAQKISKVKPASVWPSTRWCWKARMHAVTVSPVLPKLDDFQPLSTQHLPLHSSSHDSTQHHTRALTHTYTCTHMHTHILTWGWKWGQHEMEGRIKDGNELSARSAMKCVMFSGLFRALNLWLRPGLCRLQLGQQWPLHLLHLTHQLE